MQMWTIWIQRTFDCAPFAPIVRVSFWIDEFDVITGNELKYWHFGLSVMLTVPQWKKIYSADGKKFAETSSQNKKIFKYSCKLFLSKVFKEKEASQHRDLGFLFQQKMSFKPCCSHSGLIVCALQKHCVYSWLYTSVGYNRHITWCVIGV